MKIFHKYIIAATSSAAFFAGEAWAAAHGETMAHDIAHVDPHGAVGDAAHHSGGGLPQLDPTWYMSQTFWLVVVFAAMYIIFSRSILPSISATLENRHEQVQGDLETAQNLKDEAETVHQSYEKALNEARSKASELYREVENDIKAKSEKQLGELRDRLQKETDLSEARIEKAKTEAMKKMDAIAAEVASQAAEKIVGISTDLNLAQNVVKGLNEKSKKAA